MPYFIHIVTIDCKNNIKKSKVSKVTDISGEKGGDRSVVSVFCPHCEYCYALVVLHLALN